MSQKIVNFSWDHVDSMCNNIVAQIARDCWRPDYVVGIVGGGSIPATIISNILDVPCYALKVSLSGKNAIDTESNAWMSEDIFGYNDQIKRVLIVNDFNDTGSTINWIRQDWQSLCHRDNTDEFHAAWLNNVRIAALVNNVRSDYSGVRYLAHEIDSAEENIRFVFPWEKKDFVYY